MIYVNDNIQLINIHQALKKVSKQRAEYALKYRQLHDQKLSLAVFLLLKDALRKEYGIWDVPDFGFGYHGKPLLKGYPNIHFNLSHCHEAAICVIDNKPVGCDIESVPDELDMDICNYCFNKKEIEEILADENPTRAFTKFWTMKEAFLKLTGEGLTNDLRQLFFNHQEKLPCFNTCYADDFSYVYTVCKWRDEQIVS